MRALLIAISLLASIGCEGSALGRECSDTAPCAPNLVCAETTTPGVRVCMNACDLGAGRLCSDGTVCVESSGACYLGGRVSIGSACTTALECEAGTTCSPDLMLCEQACTVGELGPCGLDGVCVNIGGGICRGGVFAECSDSQPCEARLVCAASDRMERPSCMQPCSGTRLCSDTSVCLEDTYDTLETLVCYVGGSSGFGAPCTSSLECVPGGICSSDRGICEQACTAGVTTCIADEATCVDVDGGLCRTS